MKQITPVNIILAADHAGFNLKESVRTFLEAKGYTVLDVGAHELVPEDDYPPYMIAAAMKVAADMNGETKAIIFGKSGQGEAMVANRFPGVRAAVWYGDGEGVVKLSREHNDANVLSIGAGFVTEEDTKKVIEIWISTPFSAEEKHERRIHEIDNV